MNVPIGMQINSVLKRKGEKKITLLETEHLIQHISFRLMCCLLYKWFHADMKV